MNRIVLRLWELIEQGDYEDAPAFIFSLYREFRITGIDELDPDTLCRHFAELGFYREQENHADLLRRHREPEVRDEGVRLIRKLAGFGYAEAQYTLGTRYWRGDLSAYGIPQDKARAVEWIRKAAEQRHQAGMAALTECLWNGEGTPRNRLEAIEWGSRSLAYPEYDSYPEYLLHRARESLRDFAGSVRSFLTDMFE